MVVEVGLVRWLSGNLTLIPGTYTVEGEIQFSQVLF